MICSIHNEAGNSAECEVGMAGPLATGVCQAGPWPVSPITLCAEAHAIHGPVTPLVQTIAKTCISPGEVVVA